MNKLEKNRKIINKVDSKVAKLFAKRMKAVAEIAQYKIENKMQVTDASREKELLAKNLSRVSDKNLKKYYEFVFLGFLKASKEFQKKIIENHKKSK